MVLPAPPADDASGQGAWISAIRRELSLTSKGLVVLVDRARPAPLRSLVRALLPDYPDLDVHTDVTDVYRVPEGSVMVLAPRAENADWLNVQRPVFARRALKVILWCDEGTTEALARDAVDFFDWISHRHECPDEPPLHGVFGIRTALCARAPGIVWTGGDLEACFRAALPGRGIVRLSAGRPFPELVEAVRAAGRAWIVWDDVTSSLRHTVMEQVLVEAGRRSPVTIDNSDGHGHFGWPQFHGQCISLQSGRKMLAKAKAPGQLIALAGLEPEAVALINILLQTSDDERSIEQTLRDAEDPGAAIARRMGAKRWIESMQLRRNEIPPPILRAFHKDAWLAKVWERGRWERIRRDPERMAWDAVNIAVSASVGGKLDEAEGLVHRAVEIAEQVLGPASRAHAEALRALATVMRRRGRFRETEELLRRALDIPGLKENPQDFLTMLHSLADVLMQQGRYSEAEEIAQRALSVARSETTASNVEIQNANHLLEKIRSLRARSSGGGTSSE